MCNCIKEVEERLKTNIIKMPEYANLKVENISLDNTAIMFSGGEEITGSATISHETIRRKTKTVINICYRYCPFCGVRYKLEETE